MATFDQQNQNPQGVRSSRISGRTVWGLGGTALDTYANLRSGDDLGTAAVKGLATGMLWTAAPHVMTAYTAATTVPSLAVAANRWHRQREQWWNQQHLQGTVGGNYTDTRRAQTMRQAAVQAIQGSKLNARSALGGEAKILNQNFHRG